MLTLASLKKGQAKVGTYIHTWRTMKDKYMAGHGPVFWCCEHRYYYRSRIGIEIQKSKIQKYLSRRAIFSLLITSADSCSFLFLSIFLFSNYCIYMYMGVCGCVRYARVCMGAKNWHFFHSFVLPIWYYSRLGLYAQIHP